VTYKYKNEHNNTTTARTGLPATKMSHIIFFNSLRSQVKACYANTGHVLWMSLQNTHIITDL